MPQIGTSSSDILLVNTNEINWKLYSQLGLHHFLSSPMVICFGKSPLGKLFKSEAHLPWNQWRGFSLKLTEWQRKQIVQSLRLAWSWKRSLGAAATFQAIFSCLNAIIWTLFVVKSIREAPHVIGHDGYVLQVYNMQGSRVLESRYVLWNYIGRSSSLTETFLVIKIWIHAVV